jgi:prephenate dehydrogenase
VTRIRKGLCMHMERLAIIGLGMMGGSLGMAARRRRVAGSVVGFERREAHRRRAVELGAVDAAVEEVGLAVEGADLIVLCVPVLAIPEMARACLPHVAESAVVTDVGSTKEAIVNDLRDVFSGRGCAFIGSHPVAGSSASGIEAAREDLYAGATVVVTPVDGARAEDVARVRGLWEGVGGRVASMTPVAHDRVMARTSHLPHLVASMLVQSIRRDDEDVMPFCGSGYRCTTRIAGGSEEVWHDIVKTNSTWVLRELEAFGAVFDEVRGMLQQGDFDSLRDFLSAARVHRSACEKEVT